MRTFTFADGKSNKFWNIELKGASFTIQFGKAGTSGQTQVKEFPNEAAALKAQDKLIAEKLAKGYRETTTAGAAAALSAPTPGPSKGPLTDPVLTALLETCWETPDGDAPKLVLA